MVIIWILTETQDAEDIPLPAADSVSDMRIRQSGG